MRMELGFETIGNATLICHDRDPILVTDPWLVGGAYFESWTFAHEIPEAQMSSILATKYVWISHGHPDHLSSQSLKLLKDKKILLPDHVGRRIYGELQEQGYDVHILRDRVWNQLSDKIRVLCISDYNQDGILLVDINGRLIVNLNDAGERGWGHFVRKTVKGYKTSFLLRLSGFGDADMINYFTEDGKRILPVSAERVPFGQQIASWVESFGVTYFVPFSSMHRYQRKDSLWASQCVTHLSDHSVGFKSTRAELLPAYIRYDCVKDKFECINPPERTIVPLSPEDVGDSWEEPLDHDDVEAIQKYFKDIQYLADVVDFINIKVAGTSHRIELNKKQSKRGVTFEIPRNSLMTCIKYEIFDDLLIGNFMKTTLHGNWPGHNLYPTFIPAVPKYADNGRVKTREELAHYLREYRRRDQFNYFRHLLERGCSNILRTYVSTNSPVYQKTRALYFKVMQMGR